jgi:hypothetical protein
MAFLTSVCKRVTGETASFIEHRQFCVATRFELSKRKMAARGLIMASAAEIRHMTNRAAPAIKRRVFSVNVVLPSRRV